MKILHSNTEITALTYTVFRDEFYSIPYTCGNYSTYIVLTALQPIRLNRQGDLRKHPNQIAIVMCHMPNERLSRSITYPKRPTKI